MNGCGFVYNVELLASDVVVQPFTKQVGPTIVIANSIEIFNTFFSDELIIFLYERQTSMLKTV